MLIICAWPNQTNYAKFNLYDYSLVAAIMLCCYAYMVHCCNLGTHICFVVNCKSSYAISTMLVCVVCAKSYYTLLLIFPFSKVLVYRYLYNVICVLCCYVYLIQNSQAVKKVCGPQKGYGEKKCEIQGGGLEMAVMVG